MIINSAIQSIAGAYANSNTVKKMNVNATNSVQAQDEIQLSTEAKSFSSVLSKLKGGADQVRQDKVVYYENMVAAGNYNVSSSDIASSMLAARY